MSPRTRSKELIDRREVARIASLAKLSLTPQEEEKYSGELTAILEYFKVMDGARVPETAPGYYATDVENSFRGDEVTKTDPEPILAGVPRRKGRFVKAPRVF